MNPTEAQIEEIKKNCIKVHYDEMAVICDIALESFKAPAVTREEAIEEFRMDELDAVMQSVDKWFEEGDERLKLNPATRAAHAREIALKAIEAPAPLSSEAVGKLKAVAKQARLVYGETSAEGYVQTTTGATELDVLDEMLKEYEALLTPAPSETGKCQKPKG